MNLAEVTETILIRTGDLHAGAAREAEGAIGEPFPSNKADFPHEFGGYRLLGLLGRGGMGAVYEAEQLATGRRVGLKMLDHRLDSPDMRRRFLREGRLAAAVSHPNSLYVFGSEEIEGHPVITMELAAGGTLKDKLDKRGPLPVAEAVDAILDVIAGLEAAFTGGVLHRDVKPSNCFVNSDGSVQVGDFGLSVSTLTKTDSFVTATGVIMGTPAYASPEQLRGDELDARADIYSVGATLFTLLTGRAPFDGQNAVQVVANAMNQKPRSLIELRKDVPAGLERVVARCLAKEPKQRFADYTTLRNALLPFSSKEPEPASMKARAAAGWIDFLIAFLTPYVPLTFLVGAEEFHIKPFVEPSLYGFRYYLVWLCFGCLYFGLAEGIWGGGLGKRLMGLRVVAANGRRAGVGRALLRILVIMGSIEFVRIPVLLAMFARAGTGQIGGFHVLTYNIVTEVCPWIPVLFVLKARRENGFSTLWDRASGTRVIVKPEGIARPAMNPETPSATAKGSAEFLGPFRVLEEIVPGHWMVAIDPVLRRRVWLVRRKENAPSAARQHVARPGRLRWLQKVEGAGGVWDAFEATRGTPFSELVKGDRRVPWGMLRHWLDDLASELLGASKDGTLPKALTLDHVWITAQDRAVLLDEPWPGAPSRAESVSVGDFTGQQRFLSTVAAGVDSTRLPLHARGVLRNLKHGKFEKLSFLTGVLRGLLNKPCEVGKWLRAGSIFMLPVYVWIMVVVGSYTGAKASVWWQSPGGIALAATGILLAIRGLFQLLELPFRTTCSHSIFRLAVVDSEGERAGRGTLLRRWAIVWLPLFVPGALIALLWAKGFPSAAFIAGLVIFALWIGAAIHAVLHPNRGLHDRLAGTWVVRQ
jgi:eukaryotic-like serine/threonine-protein kinase